MRLIFIQMAVGQDNDGISPGDQPSGGTIEADFTAAGLTFDGVGTEAGTVIDIQNLHLLVGEDISLLHKATVDSHTTLVVNVHLGNSCAMDFTFQHYSHQFLPLKLITIYTLPIPPAVLQPSVHRFSPLPEQWG